MNAWWKWPMMMLVGTLLTRCQGLRMARPHGALAGVLLTRPLPSSGGGSGFRTSGLRWRRGNTDVPVVAAAAAADGAADPEASARNANKCLVIVESPAKAKTIQKFLEEQRYVVDFCLGHVRDVAKGRELPKELKQRPFGNTGVNVLDAFTPHYVKIASKLDVLERLQDELDGSDELILATDEDREGEAISWHLLEVLELPRKIPVRRAVFHEITREAIDEAFRSPRTIDMDLVRAQETRRIVDRLVGFMVSPLLWKKVAPKLSAGRVQSVGMALIVQRERERLNHVMVEYYDARTTLAVAGGELELQLHSLLGRRVAGGKDIDSKGRLKEESDSVLLDRDMIEAHVGLLAACSTDWVVSKIEARQQHRKPPKPFTTSTLQQEANKKLRFGASATMRHAQKLYEAGFITYMRTDSTTLSKQAVDQAVTQVEAAFGAEYVSTKLPGSGDMRKKEASKFAQEAHEAIRPTVSDETSGFPDPAIVEAALPGAPARLYKLVLQRTLASVMAEGVLNMTTLNVKASGVHKLEAVFRAGGKTVVFPGFLSAYSIGGDDTGVSAATDDVLLPPLTEGERLSLVDVSPVQHHTQPPARFTEASFVKELEQRGVGRPSTYAQIVETLKARSYVRTEGRALVPSVAAFAVAALLENHCPDLVDAAFTARMESELDEIAQGQADPQDYLSSYFLGTDLDIDRLASGRGEWLPEGAVDSQGHEQVEISSLGLVGATRVMEAVIHGDQGRQVHLPALEHFPSTRLLVGPYGAWLEHADTLPSGEEPDVVKATVPSDLAENVGLLTRETIAVLLDVGKGKWLGHDEGGRSVTLKVSRFGPYLEVSETGGDAETAEDAPGAAKKPKKGMTLTLPRHFVFTDPGLTLDTALQLLALPREVATHPESGRPVLVGLDRFGPFLRCGGQYKTLPPSVDPLTLSEAEALKLAESMDAAKQAATEDELNDIEFGLFEGTMLTLKRTGRFGPYMRWGTVNTAVPKSLHDALDMIPADTAWQLIEKKRRKVGGGKAGSGKPASAPAKAPAKRTAWSCFVADRRPTMADQSFGDSIKALSAEWKAMGVEERRPFEDLAASWGPPATEAEPKPNKKAANASTKRKAPARTTGKAGKKGASPKRSPNAYMLFCADHRPEVATTMEGAGIAEVSRELGARWKRINDEERAHYQNKAKEFKAERQLAVVG